MNFLRVNIQRNNECTLYITHTGLIESILNYLGLNGTPKQITYPLRKCFAQKIMVHDVKNITNENIDPLLEK